MNLAQLKPTLGTALLATLARINGLSKRDRMALLAGGLAVLVGIEIDAVWGLHLQRLNHIKSQTEPALAQREAKRVESAQLRERLERLKYELTQAERDLYAGGGGSDPHEVFAALRKTLSIQGLQVVSLAALPDAQTVSDAPNAAPDAPSAAPLYRHRAELRVSGALPDITRAMLGFEGPATPMRLERIRLVAAQHPPTAVEATLVLVTISQERTWLTM